MILNKPNLLKELQFKAIKSSGAGGQHVNKVSTKVELIFDLENSNTLSKIEKERLKNKLSSKLTKNYLLILFSDETRSQHRNKEIVVKRFFDTLTKNLIIPKKRKKTKPSRNAIKKRLNNKKRTSEKKSLRKKPKL